jgi:hypothetical protein
MMDNEQSNYDEERLIIRAPSSATPTMAQQIRSFKGWVIAASEHVAKRIAGVVEGRNGSMVILDLTNQGAVLKANGNQKSLSQTHSNRDYWRKSSRTRK